MSDPKSIVEQKINENKTFVFNKLFQQLQSNDITPDNITFFFNVFKQMLEMINDLQINETSFTVIAGFLNSFWLNNVEQNSICQILINLYRDKPDNVIKLFIQLFSINGNIACQILLTMGEIGGDVSQKIIEQLQTKYMGMDIGIKVIQQLVELLKTRENIPNILVNIYNSGGIELVMNLLNYLGMTVNMNYIAKLLLYIGNIGGGNITKKMFETLRLDQQGDFITNIISILQTMNQADMLNILINIGKSGGGSVVQHIIQQLSNNEIIINDMGKTLTKKISESDTPDIEKNNVADILINIGKSGGGTLIQYIIISQQINPAIIDQMSLNLYNKIMGEKSYINVAGILINIINSGGNELVTEILKKMIANEWGIQVTQILHAMSTIQPNGQAVAIELGKPLGLLPQPGGGSSLSSSKKSKRTRKNRKRRKNRKSKRCKPKKSRKCILLKKYSFGKYGGRKR